MTERPRVLLLTGALGPGGTELSVEALARGLHRTDAAGVRLALLGEGGSRAARLREEGVPVSELRLRGRLWRPDNAVRLLRLAGLVRRHRIDIVHTFLFDADVYGMLAARLGRPRAVVTTRRALKRTRPHHLRGYRLTNRFADRIVANSEAVRRFTLERERVSAGKLLVIPNGVDVARMAGGDGPRFRRGHAIPENACLIGASGTVKWVKGQDLLLEAMLPLMRERSDLHLLIAGAATGGFAGRLRARVAEAGLEARVRLPGHVESVPDLLAALDLFVLPSRSEGMSNALLEAMAAGRPIVATDVGGNRECLIPPGGGEEAVAGLVVPPEDPAALREAVARLLADAALRRRLGERARRRAAEHYSLAAMIDRTSALYRKLLEEGRGR